MLQRFGAKRQELTTCAPNRVPQEHEVSTTIKNSQAVWSEATRKREHPGGNYLSRPGK
jgi:hypothetical protein